MCLYTIYFCAPNDLQLSIGKEPLFLVIVSCIFLLTEEQILLSDNAACLAVQVKMGPFLLDKCTPLPQEMGGIPLLENFKFPFPIEMNCQCSCCVAFPESK